MSSCNARPNVRPTIRTGMNRFGRCGGRSGSSFRFWVAAMDGVGEFVGAAEAASGFGSGLAKGTGGMGLGGSDPGLSRSVTLYSCPPARMTSPSRTGRTLVTRMEFRWIDLRSTWLQRMRDSKAPLTEKMTLFWHGHFATSMEKVRDPYLLWKQNNMLRTFALGNFRELTKAVTKDPAMMFYLDVQRSNRDAPNENFARELMELFTLGEGNYSETDIRNSARAFTGYKVDRSFEGERTSHAPHRTNFRVWAGKVCGCWRLQGRRRA